MAEYSFDIGSKIDGQELNNALDIARKEIDNRFDFKGANAEIKLEKDSIQLQAVDKVKMKQLVDVVQSKLAKRDLSLKAFKFGEYESNVTGIAKCSVEIQNGLNSEQTKKITKLIKDSKLKVQARIQGDQVRITGKNKDDLQAVQQKIKEANFDFDATFDNYR